MVIDLGLVSNLLDICLALQDMREMLLDPFKVLLSISSVNPTLLPSRLQDISLLRSYVSLVIFEFKTQPKLRSQLEGLILSLIERAEQQDIIDSDIIPLMIELSQKFCVKLFNNCIATNKREVVRCLLRSGLVDILADLKAVLALPNP